MITLEQAEPGKEVTVNGEVTTILTGSYIEERLGPMIKTNKYPGGYPADKHFFIGQQEAEVTDAVIGTTETLPAVIFEGVILDEKEPVKFTPALIREKSKPFLDLKIKDVFDEPGLKAVKSARMKIVKTRTAIAAIEKVELGKLKTEYEGNKAKVTDYAATLYAACKEGEDDLQAKINTHETEKAAAAKKLADEQKEKTEGRNNAMYAAGMTFNGTGFSGYGKFVGQDVLHAMADDKYKDLLVEIEGLSIQQGVTGTTPAPAMVPEAQPVQGGGGFGGGGWGIKQPVNKDNYISGVDPYGKSPRVYDTAIYERALPTLGARLIITNGVIEADADAIVANDRILESYYYIQIVK